MYTNVHCNIIHNSQKVETTCSPPTDELISKMQCIHTMEYDLATKRNEVLIPAATGMNLENTLSERSQTQKGKWLHFYKVFGQANSQRQKGDSRLPAARRGGERMGNDYSFFLFFFLAAPHSLWDLSSLTRGRTWALSNESTESYRWTSREFPGE